MANLVYMNHLREARKALLNKDVAGLDNVGSELDKIFYSEDHERDAWPDIITLGEFIDYGKTLIIKGFDEKIDGKKVVVPFSKEVAEKLFDQFFVDLRPEL